MTHNRFLALAVLTLSLLVCASAADIAGTWTSSFDTQIGKQEYTYTFKVDGGKLTGTAKSANGETAIQDGKVDGDTVTFVENLKFQDMDIRIDYTGKIVSADEIKFTRKVGDFATEELVAKRAK
jgi:opacity protein-like surface antigen